MNRFQRLLLLWSAALTAGTGVVYWYMDTMLEPVSEWAAVNHPLQPWVLKAHIIVAPILVFAIGLITMEHIWKHYRSAVQRGRRSGLTAMWVIVPMVLSGYLIQSITQESWLTVMVWVHVGTGLLFGLGILLHWWVIRRSRATVSLRREAGVSAGSGADPEMRPATMRRGSDPMPAGD